VPMQYDPVLFFDAIVDGLFLSPLGLLLPQEIRDEIANKNVVGSYKGRVFILNPNGFPSVAFVASREDILSSDPGISLDFVDVTEILDFGMSLDKRFITAHTYAQYNNKIAELYRRNSTRLKAVGFEKFSACSPGTDYLCEGFCSDNGVCSSGQLGDACFSSDGECKTGRCAWTFEGFRCTESQAVPFVGEIPVLGDIVNMLFGWIFDFFNSFFM